MKDLEIATMTLDKKGDAELMKSSLEVLSNFRYSVHVADGGSSPKFVDALKKMGHKVEYAQGLTAQHKNSISRASDKSPFVLYTEPDKHDWFVNGFEESVDTYFKRDKGSGLLLVARTPEQLKTFPPHQQEWEGKLAKEIITPKTGVNGDFTYGPRFFPSELGIQVKDVKDAQGWETITFLVGRAYKMGLPINMLYTAAECPLDQRGEDNAKYRQFQFNCNKKGFELGLK